MARYEWNRPPLVLLSAYEDLPEACRSLVVLRDATAYAGEFGRERRARWGLRQ